MKKPPLFLTFFLISFLSFAQCPSNNLVLGTQQEVDDFLATYPDCTSLEISLEVKGSGISNLNGLKNLTAVKSLRIRETSLTDLSGLENLKNVEDLYLGFNSLLANLNGLQNLVEIFPQTPGSYGILKLEYNNSLTTLEGLNNLEKLYGIDFSYNSSLSNIEALTKVSGELDFVNFVQNKALQSLKGLENIQKIARHFNLLENNLQDLAPLNNLTSVGGIRVYREPNLPNFAGLKNLEYVEEYFIITNNNNLQDLTGLESLTVEDSLRIDLTNNPQLTSLKGLDNLTKIKDLQVYTQNLLLNFENLTSLEVINGELSIRSNTSLGTFKGLENLRSAKKIVIENNESLQTISGLTSLEQNEEIKIHNNNALLDLVGLENLKWTDNLVVQNNDNLTRLCTFNHLNEMGAFWIRSNSKLTHLEGLEIIEHAGSVYLSDLPVTSISGFQNLQTAKNLTIYALNSLETLEGLENLNSLEEYLEISSNQKLNSTGALRNLQSVGEVISIEDNTALQALTGLENITALSNYLLLDKNPVLTDLSSLQNLQSLKSLKVDDNDQLENLDGLNGLRSIETSIHISFNENLTNIDGLRNINFEPLLSSSVFSPFSIRDNPNLSECAIANICNYLSHSSVSSNTIFNNGPNCTSKEEVLANCSTGLNNLPGKIGYDQSGTGCEENQELVNNLLVKTSNGENTFTTSTNNAGIFDFFVGEATYETSVHLQDLQQQYFEVQPLNITTTIPGTTTTDSLFFCIKKKKVAKDLSVTVIPLSEPRPGFTLTYYVVYKNQGTETLSGNVELEYESGKASSPQGENGIISFAFSDLKPFESRGTYFTFTTVRPPDLDLGDTLSFKASIFPIAEDETPEDNTFILTQDVIGALDPNDIKVLEGDTIKVEQVTDYLHYVIRFQNTGTAEAITVKIDHNLDEDLNWDSFVPISSSHENRIIKEGKYLSYIFDNINLPDSTSNKEGSQGFVAFKIKPKPGIAVGDLIKARAGIYFDYNPPVITNEERTLVVNEDGSEISVNILSEIACSGGSNGEIEVNLSGGTAPLYYKLYDENNELIAEGDNNSFSKLSAGNYTIKVTDSASNEFILNFTLNEPELLSATITTNMTSCSSAEDGEISFAIEGGVPPYTSSINGSNYSTTNVFDGLSEGEYTVSIKDANGCTYMETLYVSDPDDSDLDGDGIGDNCDDDVDGDGIPNDLDQCNDSAIGDMIDANGCSIFTLPNTNFTITITGETCRSANNGKLEISAEETYDYVAVLTNSNENISQEFSSSTIFQDLSAGRYDLCLTISNVPDYEQCFSLEIDEPEEFQVSTAVNTTTRTMKVNLAGSDEYIVKLNGKTYKTSSDVIELPLNSNVNALSIETNMECQGIFKQNILLEADIMIYPNPVTKAEVSVQLPFIEQAPKVKMALFTDSGKLRLKKEINTTENFFILNVDGLKPGIYTLMIYTETNTYSKRLIKQ